MLYEQNVTAGSPLQLNVPGRFFLLDSTGAESVVTVTLMRGGSPIFGQIPGASRGLKIGVEGGFDGVRIEAAGNCTVRFFATFENVSISTTDGAEVSIPGGVEVANTAANPVPVDVLGAVVTVNDFVMKSDGAVTDATAAPTNIAAQFAAVDATRRSMRIKNNGAVDVAIGGAGVVFSTAAVVLMPGELWVEDHGAGCAWFAVTQSAAGALAYQEVK